MQKGFLLWSVIIFSAIGCATPPPAPVLPTAEFVTATLPSTPTPAESATSLPPTAAATLEPIPGTTTSEVNLRAEPSTASPSLGIIPAFSAVQVEGKESFGYWVRIQFEGNKGWVRAEYVQASAEIPVSGAESDSGSGVRGAILRGVNVRSGPGRDFDSLGLLNQYDVVEILERDSQGEWLRIKYPPAPDGAGWVASEYLQADGTETLPVAGAEDQSTELPGAPDTPSNTTAAVYWAEGDSADAPLAMFTLSPATVRSIRFQGEVSAIDGDNEDWVGFSAGLPKIRFQILCDAGIIRAELLPGIASIQCGEAQTIETDSNFVYLIKITPYAGGAASYDIRISATD